MSLRPDPHDLSSMWNRRLREIARSAEIYACPYCTDRKIFHQESRLFDHVETTHADQLAAATADTSSSAFRDELRAQAREKGGTGAAAFRSRPSTRSPPIVVPVAEESVETACNDGKRPWDVTGPPQMREIGDIRRLSLTQGRGTLTTEAPQDPSTDAPLAPLGPRKRAAAADPGPNEARSSPINQESDVKVNPRRSKARSGGALVPAGSSWDLPDPDFRRATPTTGDGPGLAPSAGGQKRLFDPSTDDPIAHSHPDPSTLAAARPTTYDPRAHVLRSKEDARRREFRGSTRDRRWSPGRQRPSSSPQQSHSFHVGAPPKDRSRPDASGATSSDLLMLLQPETRPISQEKLVAEVKGIYAGLVMVEAKCVEVVGKQVAAAHEAGRQPRLSDEQWQALIALHRTLLHEHHDFFLASQHPSASPELRRLAVKYSMPARMWRHGIHPFLELLRYRLPGSLDHMLAFIYLAYSMMALLYETVPAFEDTWIECLGDLGRYRMAIEDDNLRDREVWTGVARFWYSKAADKNPNVGRLYHHLAILARPNALQQLYYYARSLTCVQPFLSARESIMTLFDPILKGKEPAYYRPLPMERNFIRTHALLFTGDQPDALEETTDRYLSALDKHIGRVTAKWKEQGVYILVANVAALFEYGSTESPWRAMFEQHRRTRDAPPEEQSGSGPATSTPHSGGVAGSVSDMPSTAGAGEPTTTDPSSETKDRSGPEARARQIRDHARHVTFATLALAVQRIGDLNVLPHLLVSLVFLWSTAKVGREAMEMVEQAVPWDGIVAYLNALATPDRFDARILDERFPLPKDPQEKPRPLREDFAVNGQIWTEDYFPANWFIEAMVDDEERNLELPSMVEPRVERVLWLSVRVATFDRWLRFDRETKRFSVGPAMDGLQGQRDRRWYEIRTYTPPPSGDDDEDDDDHDGDVEMSGTREMEGPSETPGRESPNLAESDPSMDRLKLEQSLRTGSGGSRTSAVLGSANSPPENISVC